jgi:hypothetical protein
MNCDYSFSFEFGVYDPTKKGYKVLNMPTVSVDDGWETIGFRAFNRLVEVIGFAREGDVFSLAARGSQPDYGRSGLGCSLQYIIAVPKSCSWVHDMQRELFRSRSNSPVIFSVSKLRRILLREKQEVRDLYGLREQAYWPEGSHPSRYIGYRR